MNENKLLCFTSTYSGAQHLDDGFREEERLRTQVRASLRRLMRGPRASPSPTVIDLSLFRNTTFGGKGGTETSNPLALYMA